MTVTPSESSPLPRTLRGRLRVVAARLDDARALERLDGHLAASVQLGARERLGDGLDVDDDVLVLARAHTTRDALELGETPVHGRLTTLETGASAATAARLLPAHTEAAGTALAGAVATTLARLLLARALEGERLCSRRRSSSAEADTARTADLRVAARGAARRTGAPTKPLARDAERETRFCGREETREWRWGQRWGQRGAREGAGESWLAPRGGFRITCPGVARRTDAGRDGRRGGSTRARAGAREWSSRDITTTRSETGRGPVAGRGGLGAPPPSRAMGIRQRRRPKPFSAANRGGAESTGSARWGAREATYAPAQRWRKRRWTPSRWTPLCLWCLELGQHVRCATPWATRRRRAIPSPR